MTERGEVVARLVRRGRRLRGSRHRYGATVPVETLEVIAARLTPPGAAAGTTDAFLADSRTERVSGS